MPVIPTYDAHEGLDPDQAPRAQVSTASAEAAGQVGRAVQGLGASLSDLGAHMEQRQNEKDSFNAQIGLQQTHQSILQSDIEAQKNMTADGSGWAESRVQAAQQTTNAFLSTVQNPKLREEYAQRSAVLVDELHTKYATEQLNQQNNYFTQNILKNGENAGNSILRDPSQLDAQIEQQKNLIAAAGSIPAPERMKLQQKLEADLQMAYVYGLARRNPAAAQAALGVLPKPGMPGGVSYPVRPAAPPSVGLQGGSVAPSELPAGMRNNNPGNIKYVGQSDAVGPSQNTDQGDKQAVYATQQDGMNAAASLMLTKFQGGKVTVGSLIAGQGGWTPGNMQAAANIAKAAGVGVDQPLDLRSNPGQFHAVMRGLLKQEHGDASNAYPDMMIDKAIATSLSGQGEAHLQPAAYRTGGDSEAPDTAKDAVRGNITPAAVGTPGAGLVPYLAKGKDPAAVTNLNSAFSSRLQTALANAPPEVQQGTTIASGFRSNDYQAGLYQAALQKYGSEAVARAWVAPPGHSNHNAGQAADLSFKTDAAKQWWHDNADKYGLKFPLANEAWHIEPKETRGGGGTQIAPPTYPVPNATAPDPRLAGIPFEKRLAISNDIDRQQKMAAVQASAQQTADHEAFMNQMELGIHDGKVGWADLETARQNGQVTQIGDIDRLESRLRKQDGQTEALGAFNQAIGDPGYHWNPLDDDHKKMVDAGYAQLSQKEGSPLAMQHVVQKTGMLPTDAGVALRGALVRSPQEAQSALQVGSRLLQGNPNVFAGMKDGSGFADNVVTFNHYVNDLGKTAEQASQQIFQEQQPEYQQKVKAIVKGEDLDKVVKDNLTPTDLAKAFNEGWTPLGRPAVEANPAARQAAMGDYEELFRENFLKTGDVSRSKTLAVEQMKRVWGVTNVTGSGILTRYPIEKAPAYQGVDDVAGKFAAAAQAQIKAETGDDIPRDRLVINSTNETPNAYKAGLAPPVLLGWFDKNGLMHAAQKPLVVSAESMHQAQQAERRMGFDAAQKAQKAIEAQKDADAMKQANDALAQLRASRQSLEEVNTPAEMPTPPPASDPNHVTGSD